MNWQKLKENKCPKCNNSKLLDYYNPGTKTLGCKKCGFRIGEEKMREIVIGRVVRGLSKDLEDDIHNE